MSKRCIYCDERPADSKEHWLPRWFGAFREVDTLHDRLCQTCNGELGALDDEMSHTGPVALARHLLAIEGRHKGVERPAPAYFRAQGPDLPTISTYTPAGFGHPILAEDIPGTDPLQRMPQRQVALRKADGSWCCIPITLDKPAGWLRAALSKHGVTSPPEEVEVHCDEEETDAVVRIVQDAIPAFRRMRCYTRDGASQVAHAETVLDITVTYARGMAKLAFHYALLVCPHFDGAEAAFAPLRSFIKHGEGAWDTFFRVGQDKNRWLTLPNNEAGHILALEAGEDVARVSLSLFCGTPYSKPMDLVILAESVSPTFSPFRTAHVLRYYAQDQRAEYDGEIRVVPAAGIL